MSEPNGRATEHPAEVYLQWIAKDIKTIRELFGKVIFYITEAESEIPEKIRRYMNYMHDVHDIKYMYEEQGHDVPRHVLNELERLDDRYRQILSELTAEGGAFAKVRREMAADPMNRWDHTRQLPGPTHKQMETKDETGTG
jgi:hypothetical protein